ncbi:hypothetical protein AOLI_G00113440 [Acnodon oligacanthus]
MDLRAGNGSPWPLCAKGFCLSNKQNEQGWLKLLRNRASRWVHNVTSWDQTGKLIRLQLRNCPRCSHEESIFTNCK